MIDMLDIIAYPLLVSIPLSLLVGPVGALLVWRKSSFLTDVIAHMGIMAYVFSEVLNLPVLWVSIALSIGISLLLEWGPKFIPKDAWLASIASFGLALGVLLLSMLGSMQDVEHLFWGDLFVLTAADVSVFSILAAFLGMNIWVCWRYFLLIIFHEDLAKLDGVPVRFIKLIFNIVVGSVVAMSLKVIGILLASALFVLPAVGLRFLMLGHKLHIIFSVVLIMFSIWLGLGAAITIDAAAAPLIIIALLILNLTALLVKKGIDRRSET
jgi:zinc transport system permease protein